MWLRASQLRPRLLLIAIISPALLGSYAKCSFVSNPSLASDPVRPIARIEQIEPAKPPVGEMMRVTGTGHGAQPLEFAWDFGDGTLAVGSQASHTYVAPGDYRLTLTVRGASGDSASDTTIVAVAPRITPTGLSSVLISYAVAGQPVVFSALTLGEDPDALSYVWTFSDGQSVIGARAIAIFPVAGTYLVTVAVVNDVGATTLQISFPIAEAPQ